MKFNRRQPEIGVPSKGATEEALRELSQHFSKAKVLRSVDHPELSARGEREVMAMPPDPDSSYRDRHYKDFDDDI